MGEIRKYKSVLMSLSTLVAVGALLAGCQSNSSNNPSSNSNSGSAASSSITIGEFTAMSGDQATFGVSNDRGLQMAVEEINSKGGVNGLPLKVKLYDDQGLPDQAKTVVTKLIEQDNVTAVIGDVASSNTLQAAPEAQKTKVPLITPASTNVSVTKTGDYIFRTCFIDPFQGGVMATFATKQLHAKTAAILFDNSQDYSKGLAAAFRTGFMKLGGKIVADEAFQKGALDYHSQLSNIKAANPDVIFVPTYYNSAGAIGRTARGLGITVPLLGGDGWDSDELFTNAGGNLEGCYFSNHYSIENTSPLVKSFVAAYQKKYNGGNPDAMAALAYDATKIVASAITAAGKPSDGDYSSPAYRAKLRDALAAVKNFNGVTGVITIGSDRNAIKPAVVLQVKGNKRSFVTTVNPADVPL
jgi:branched-chain amino acid transport system substrate-binding protein